MKKTHAFGLLVVAMFAFSVAVAASASAATTEWLKNSEPVTSALATTTTGSLELGNPNGLGLGVKVAALCTGSFVGTVEAKGESEIKEILNAANEATGLGGKEVSCTNVENCESASAAPVGLPWLDFLVLSGSPAVVLDVIVIGGGLAGPGWDVMCNEPLVGLVEETCTGSASSVMENDSAETDVLGQFLKAENNKFACSGSKENDGFTSTENDAPGLLALTGGGTLSVES